MRRLIRQSKLRLNNKVISSQQDPVYTTSKVTSSTSSPLFVTSTTAAAYASLTGALFSIALDPLTLNAASGQNPGIIELNMQNSSANSKSLYIDRIIFGFIYTTTSTNNIDFDLLFDGTFNSTGLTAKTAAILNTGSTNTSIVTAYAKDATNTDLLSGGTLIGSRRSTETTGQYIIEYSGQIIVTPGHAFTVKITNSATGGQLGSVSLTIVWWER